MDNRLRMDYFFVVKNKQNELWMLHNKVKTPDVLKLRNLI